MHLFTCINNHAGLSNKKMVWPNQVHAFYRKINGIILNVKNESSVCFAFHAKSY